MIHFFGPSMVEACGTLKMTAVAGSFVPEVPLCIFRVCRAISIPAILYACDAAVKIKIQLVLEYPHCLLIDDR